MFYKSLCLSGGGVAGFSHIGMLQKLHEKNMLRDVETVVGTSIGAVIGTLLCIGMTPEKMYDLLLPLDMKLLKFKDLNRFSATFGMDSAEYFIAHIVDMFINQNVSPLLTFADLSTLYRKRLVITGANVTLHTTDYFSVKTSPDMKILDAIRISISIPFMFSVVRYQSHVYVDGGLTDNYPLKYCIDDFRERYPFSPVLSNVLGCCIDNMPKKSVVSLEDFIYNLFACVTKKGSIEANFLPLTVYIPMANFRAIEFNVEEKKKRDMYSNGYTAAEKHLQMVKKEERATLLKQRRRSSLL
jgi:predicted acylesterase/phospholipase RssA